MLWRSTTLLGSGIRATDGDIGSIADLLFDDAHWTIRWVVVDTGDWLPGRKVLLPPAAFGPAGGVTLTFPVDLTRRQVEDSPDVAADAPVSRQHEQRVYRHYGWAPYWTPGYLPPFGLTGAAPLPLPDAAVPPPPVPEPEAPQGDPHLRSIREVTGYYVHATDGDIGHIEEFLVDDAPWAIRYLVVDTRNWWPARKVVVSPRWFRDIDWAQQTVEVAVTRAEVKSSPDYDPAALLERDHEEALHAHYGRPPYWR